MAVFRGTDRIRRATAAVKDSLRHVRSTSLKGITVVEKRMLSTVADRFRNYRIRVYAAAAIILLGVAAVTIGGHQYVKAHTNEYYQVFVQGVPVGEISSSDKVEQWIAAKTAELDHADTPIRHALEKGQVTYRYERAYKKRPDDEATLSRLAGRMVIHPIGVQLTVDGKVIGIVRDRSTADTLLKRIQKKYVPQTGTVKVSATAKQASPSARTLALSASSAASKTPAPVPARLVTSVDFVEQVDLTEVKMASGQLSDPEQLYKKLVTGSTMPVKYTVREGDCVECIAEKLKVSPETIYERNPWIGDDHLQIGDTLDLTEEKPLLNVQWVEQVTQIEPVEPKVEYRTSEDMRAGKTVVLRKGKEGRKQVTYRLVKKNGSLMEEEMVSEQMLEAAVSAIVLKGTKVIAGEGSGKFAWPVSGHRITSYMGKRWGRMHNGIDLVGGSGIMAADDGVIEFAGYKSGGGGNTIIIDHKNGFKTVYMHLKKVTVRKGQIVEKGEKIGIMGSTGRSTGTHLHFEIMQDGQRKNPTNFL